MAQLVSDVTEILDYKDNKKQAKTQRNAILQQMASDEKDKKNLVNKALASQRAKYGASGMSLRGQTAGAVLTRLKSETEEPYKKKRQSNLEKLKATRVSKPNLLKSILSRFENLVG